ncbi:carcinoembryonic antigen-related cell adhesion molecule 5 [Ictalurus punctatus]|uniref:Carcinoembryonic antigen-related cell adhesion molecule 5 n=1 Tax=Ictalurus punctatus TaxID=7998 RepID=A0A9F7R0N9_ICTPU|nr:carcinoembryonic antigen-related cell adhesion molecule 5 [Ictalurus punctatus]XP_053536649.1 carcinoembryonic antigen-related cell adhesion molecule 5 [Ictalurus punctatus]
MDLHAVCCSLLLLSCTGVCFGQELFLPERINKAVGENVVITPIRLPDPPHAVIRWRFNEITILAGPPSGIIILPSYTDRVRLNPTTYALELRRLTESDTGLYSLTVDTPTNPFTGETSLQVFVPASNVIIVPSKTELVEFSSTVSLVCSASGSSLSFIWLNGSSGVRAGERVQLTDNNSSLTITSVTRYDTGPYQCEASNIISKARSPPLILTIYYGPENVAVEADPVGPFYSSGSNLILTCSAESNPAAEFQWAVNGTELGEMGQELRLSNIQSSQSGNYTCIAHNIQSLNYSVSEPISVTVLEKISGAALTGPTDDLIEDVSSATLSCKSSGIIYSAEWMKDNQKLSASDSITFSNDNRSVMISPVRRRDSGEYKCTLSNPISSDTATYRMIVNFGPDNVIINAPSKVEEGKTVMFSCHSESTPNALCTWMFNGDLTGVNTPLFTVEQTTFMHTGNYTCIASNPVTGRDASGSHVLVVKEKVTPGGDGESLSAGAIAGIVIGVLLGVAGIAGLIFYFMKAKEMPRTNSRGNKQNGATQNADDSNYENIDCFQNNKSGVTMSGSDTQMRTPQLDNGAIYVNIMEESVHS